MRLILRAVPVAFLAAAVAAAAETKTTDVTITADQMCAVTVDNGEPLKVTKKAPQTLALAPGEHVVAATCSGGTDKQTVTVGDQPQTVALKPAPTGAAAAPASSGDSATPRPEPRPRGSRKKTQAS